MGKHHLPKEWYVVKISYLNEVLKGIPDIRLGVHNGKEVLRVHSSTKKYVEVGKDSKKWDEYYGYYKNKSVLQNQLQTLNSELQSIYKTTYNLEKSKYEIEKNTSSKMNVEFFDMLKDNECGYANDSSYQFDGHNFRSRFEMAVAQIASDLHMTYKYDCGISLYTKKCYGDLFLVFPEFNRCVCIEIMGSMDNAEYVKRCSVKFFDYSQAGYILGEDWFILASNSYSMPNNDVIEQLLINIVWVLCAKYVKEIA